MATADEGRDDHECERVSQEYTKAMCESSIFSVCLGGGAVAEDANFCTTCQPDDLAAGVITKACEDWFWEFYSAVRARALVVGKR